jgi:hypothetical protein
MQNAVRAAEEPTTKRRMNGAGVQAAPIRTPDTAL